MRIPINLRRSLQQKIPVNIELSHPDRDSCTAIVTQLNPKFVVAREVVDFELAGLLVLPTAAIRRCSFSSVERCTESILQANGQMKKLSMPSWLQRCSTIEDIFKQLLVRDIWPIVELVEGSDSWFFIGKLTQVDAEGSLIHHYDGSGKWTKVFPVAYANLVRVEFDDRYSKHFNTYMKSRKQ